MTATSPRRLLSVLQPFAPDRDAPPRTAPRLRGLLLAIGDALPFGPMDLLGWILLGFLAGAISGWFVGTRSVQGCLPTIVVGILGGIVGGWLAGQMGYAGFSGFFSALLFAILGSILVRLVLRAIETGR
jgi:uncharacterized membrane protein YeaQ/YmgE (transglycosylase-associated protein family)